KDIDLRADVYAFGVMLYEAITGRMPFEASSLSELAIKVATMDAAPVRSLRPNVPEGLASVVDRSIARDRRQRPPDLQSLQRELGSFGREKSIRRPGPAGSAGALRLVPAAVDDDDSTTEPRVAAAPQQKVQPEPPPGHGNAEPPSMAVALDTLSARERLSVRNV